MTACAPDIARFAEALRHGGVMPPGLCGPDGAPDALRFAVYRNNVAVGLIGALRDTFPVVAALLGEECFDGVARRFAQEHPPLSPVMMDYGRGFDAFLEGFPGLEDLPFLPDLAQLERARVDAWHAADAETFALEALSRLAPEALEALRLTPHPSLTLIASPYPVVTLWRRHQEEDEPDLSGLIVQPEQGAVLRDAEDHVLVVPLSPEAFALATGSPKA